MTQAPKIGLVSLGCPKALVDSERIMTTLRAQGYAFSRDYAGADIVLVNTCGFLDSAKQESLEAIGEALAENGKVIVTGCLGVEEDLIRQTHPSVLNISGPSPITTLDLVRLVTELAGPDLGPDLDKTLEPEHIAPDPGKVRLTSGGAWRLDHAAAEGTIGWRPQVDMREGIRRLIAWREGR